MARSQYLHIAKPSLYQRLVHYPATFAALAVLAALGGACVGFLIMFAMRLCGVTL